MSAGKMLHTRKFVRKQTLKFRGNIGLYYTCIILNSWTYNLNKRFGGGAT